MINILIAADIRKAAEILQNANLLRAHTNNVEQLQHGQRLSLYPYRAEWEHPWFTRVSWNGTGFQAKVRPGLVNAIDPTVPGLTVREEDGSEREAFLSDGLAMPLHSFRTPGEDGDPIDKLFLSLGVRDPKSDLQVDENGGVTIVDSLDKNPLPPRSLRACDLYLAKARATFRATVDVVDASGTSGVTVDYGVTYDTSVLEQKGTRARLQQAAKYPAIRKPTLVERLFGDFADEAEDRLPICTVFLLSPPNVEGEPDGSWTPYVQHHAFWPLKHTAPRQAPAKPLQPIRFFSGLAGGLGDMVINQYLALNNDLADRISNAVANTTPEGHFSIA